jgi:hypothetical protein
MMRKVLYIFGVLILAGAIIAVGLSRVSATANQDVGVREEYLNPIHPGDEGWEVKPYVPAERSETVRGPSQETGYRCVSYLEPLQPGEDTSKELKMVCSSSAISSIDGISLENSFLIAKFYDNTNYGSLLIEYYGPSACSDSISYGKTALPSDLDNKFVSGKVFSDCNLINVYDFANYSGPSYACGPNCSSFYALNNYVSSWNTTH